MNALNANATDNDNGMQELTMSEVEDVSGGIICVLILCFAAGYGVGTGIRSLFK